MRILKFTVVCLFISTILFAQRRQDGETIISQNQKAYYSQVMGYTVTEVFNDKVFDLIADWINTPYKYEGKNETGIDCSGFINVVFNKVYDLQPGCSSTDMYAKAQHIKKNKLKPGDLVFFKTRGKHISHVGIYLGSNKFAHASSSNGVVVSDLDETYYAKRFVKGGRVL